MDKPTVFIIALDNLSLGRAWLLRARQEGSGATAQAADFLKRAELYRLTGDYLRAQSDLDEAWRIAERGEMGLHLCDCHLESAGLCLAQGDRDQAREHLATAKAMIEQMGYHRRDKNVEEIAQEISALR